jgi:ribosomal protein S18 acetylase RimI-like enzyme
MVNGVRQEGFGPRRLYTVAGESKEPRVRRLIRDDIAAIREIDALSFSSHDQYDAAFYEMLAESGNHEAIVATTPGGAVVAWALTDVSRQPLRIRSISVHPAFRRRGFGRALVMEILEKHHTGVDLLVEPNNVEALSLYRNLGFVETDADVEVPERIRMMWRPRSTPEA